MRIEYRFSPQILTCEIPGTVCNRSLKILLAISLRLSRSLSSLCIVNAMMVDAEALDLVTVGGSASGGNLLWDWDTLSRTSLAAASKSVPISNSTVMELLPSAEVEDRDRIPAIPLMLSSSGSVIWDSMTSELAPT